MFFFKPMFFCCLAERWRDVQVQPSGQPVLPDATGGRWKCGGNDGCWGVPGATAKHLPQGERGRTPGQRAIQTPVTQGQWGSTMTSSLLCISYVDGWSYDCFIFWAFFFYFITGSFHYETVMVFEHNRNGSSPPPSISPVTGSQVLKVNNPRGGFIIVPIGNGFRTFGMSRRGESSLM